VILKGENSQALELYVITRVLPRPLSCDVFANFTVTVRLHAEDQFILNKLPQTNYSPQFYITEHFNSIYSINPFRPIGHLLSSNSLLNFLNFQIFVFSMLLSSLSCAFNNTMLTHLRYLLTFLELHLHPPYSQDLASSDFLLFIFEAVSEWHENGY
jgi:hypothetical protein